MWVSYVSEEHGTPPGSIINDMLYYNIENEMELYLGKDLLLISFKLWEAFYDWFGGGPTLKWKFNVK